MSDLAPHPEAPATDRFEALYRRYYWSVVGFCGAFSPSRAAAEDAAQEAFERAYRYLHALDAGRSPWPWLRTIARNVMATRALRDGREIATETLEIAAADHADATGDAILIGEAWGAMSARHRAALRLRYVEGLPPETAAQRMGLRISAFNQLVFRARGRLRAELQRLGEAVPALAPLPWLRAWIRRLNARLARSGTSTRVGPDALLHAVGGVVLLLSAGLQLSAPAPQRPSPRFELVAASTPADDAPRERRHEAGTSSTSTASTARTRSKDATLVDTIQAVSESPDRKTRPRASVAPANLGIALPLDPPTTGGSCGHTPCDAVDLDQVPGSKKIGR